jgi:hypothetical protein
MFWKKKTREQQIEKRVESVFSELTSTIECEFTDLETVQILNEVRLMLAQNLENKRQKCISNITENNQKLKELKNASDYLN